MIGGFGRTLLGRRGDDEVSLTHRLVSDGELEHPVKEKPATMRTASVEPEHELVEVLTEMVEMVCFDRSLVYPEQPPLRERRYAVDVGHQLRRLILRHDVAFVDIEA